MKTLKLILIIMIVSLFSTTLPAQVSVGINIGGPARYYYLQDIEAYFDIQASMYIYLSGGRWIHARNLPPSYGHYDMNNSHRVLINNYRGNRPYSYFNQHRSSFPKGHEVSPDHNSWSPKGYKEQGKINKREAKEFKKDNKREAKDFKRDNKMNNRGNGNNGGSKGHGGNNGPGGGKGNGGGGGKGNKR